MIKRANWILAAIFIFYIGATCYVRHHFVAVCPGSADILTGHVFPLRFFGAIAYLTQAQHRTLDALNLLWLMTSLVFTIWAFWKEDRKDHANVPPVPRVSRLDRPRTMDRG